MPLDAMPAEDGKTIGTGVTSQEDAALISRFLSELDHQIGERAIFEMQWQEISRRILPRSNIFRRPDYAKGERRTEYIFNSAGIRALERFASVFDSLATPRAEIWHKLRARKPDLNKNIRVKQYCEDYTNMLFEQRYKPSANFSAQNMEVLQSSGAFGTGFNFIDKNKGSDGGWYYKSGHLANTYLMENASGRVDRIKRKWKWKAFQAAEYWGKDALPQEMQADLNSSKMREFEFIHVLEPNPKPMPGKLNWEGMKYLSYYICMDTKSMIAKGGFRTFPVSCTRYITNVNEGYGRSPGMTALPDIKMINEIDRSVLRVAQNQADPPIIARSLGQVSPFQNRPGFKNYGWISEKGEALVQYMNVGGKLEEALKIREEVAKMIDDIFFVTIFQSLIDNPQMTATQVLELARQRGALVTPFVGRFQDEYLGPMIRREIDMAEHMGLAPPMPPELQDEGGRMEIVYESPLMRAQKAEQGLGFLRVIQALAPLAAGQPDLYKRFDLGKIVPGLAEIHGMPINWLLDEQAFAAIQQQQAEQQQAEQQQAAIPAGAAAAKDLSVASQNMQGQGPIQ